jgi:hypothetical protein
MRPESLLAADQALWLAQFLSLNRYEWSTVRSETIEAGNIGWFQSGGVLSIVFIPARRRLYLRINWRPSVQFRELRRDLRSESWNHSCGSRFHMNVVKKHRFQILVKTIHFFVRNIGLFQTIWFWQRTIEAMRRTWTNALSQGGPNWCGISSAWMNAWSTRRSDRGRGTQSPPLSALHDPGIPIGQRHFYTRLSFEIISLLHCLTDLRHSIIEGARRTAILAIQAELITKDWKSSASSKRTSEVFREWTMILFLDYQHNLGILASIEKISDASRKPWLLDWVQHGKWTFDEKYYLE